MNPDAPTPREQLETRLTALLLGEVTGAEAEALRQAIAADAQLAAMQARLKTAIELVRETAADPAEQTAQPPAPLKLSGDRREKLLAHFKTVTPKEFARPKRRNLDWLIPMTAAAALVGVIGLVLWMPLGLRSSGKFGGEYATINALGPRDQLENVRQQTITVTPGASSPPPLPPRESSNQIYSLGVVGYTNLAANTAVIKSFTNSANGRASVTGQTSPETRFFLDLNDQKQVAVAARQWSHGDSGTPWPGANAGPKPGAPEGINNLRTIDSAVKDFQNEALASQTPVAAPVPVSGLTQSQIVLPSDGTKELDAWNGTPLAQQAVQLGFSVTNGLLAENSGSAMTHRWGFETQPGQQNTPEVQNFTNRGTIGADAGWVVSGTLRGFYDDNINTQSSAVRDIGAPRNMGEGFVSTSSGVGGIGGGVGGAGGIGGGMGGAGGGGIGGGYSAGLTRDDVGGLKYQFRQGSDFAQASATTPPPGASTTDRLLNIVDGAVDANGLSVRAGTVGGSLIAATPIAGAELPGGVPPTNFGDPGLIGTLDRSEQRPDGSNRFIARSAFITLPAGQTEAALERRYTFNDGRVDSFDLAIQSTNQVESVTPGLVMSDSAQPASAAEAGNFVSAGASSRGRGRGGRGGGGGGGGIGGGGGGDGAGGRVGVFTGVVSDGFVAEGGQAQAGAETSLASGDSQIPVSTLNPVPLTADIVRVPKPVADGADQNLDRRRVPSKGAELLTSRSVAKTDRATRSITPLPAGRAALEGGKEKVPVVGDVPSIGRFFRSEQDAAGKQLAGTPLPGTTAAAALDEQPPKGLIVLPDRTALAEVQKDWSVPQRNREPSSRTNASTNALAWRQDLVVNNGLIVNTKPAAQAISIDNEARSVVVAADDKTYAHIQEVIDNTYGGDKTKAYEAKKRELAELEKSIGSSDALRGARTEEAFRQEFAKETQKIAQTRQEVAILQRESGLTQTDAAAPKPATPLAEPQPEVQTVDNAFSTFSLNIADVSFKLAAASLEKGVMPDPGSVRSEEFINAFDYRDPEPAPGAPLGFAWERARYPFAHNRDLLRFSLKTAAAGRVPGRPLNLVLLLDNSGSMERADRVAIIHEALRVLASQLQPQDMISIVTFARTPRLWVDGIAGNQAAQVLEAVAGLTPEGGTNLEEAMRLAYEAALRHYLPNGVNRVVLLTDGAANLGNVDPAGLKLKVEANRKQGIALDCFGIGWEGYNDDLLEVLSRNGGGRYGFVNTPEEAATGFAGQLAGALHVAAKDVKVQVEFNPKRVTAYRQMGYAKLQLTKEQFRDNTVAAAQIGAAESGNGLYVVEVNPNGQGPIAIVRVRYNVPGTGEYPEHEWTVPYTGNAPSLDQASPAMRLAATATAFSEWLVSSPFATEVTTDRLLGYLGGVPEVYGADGRPKQLEWMIRQAKSISGK